MSNQPVTAALLIIGDEILSGRTQDANLKFLAEWLNEIGIQLYEVRVVRDDQEQIAEALNAMRTAYNYVFTTGGIGPTHDDITVDSIAYGLNVDVVVHPEADALLRSYYKEGEYTDARRRMARVPAGAELIKNPVTVAPGIKVENIFIMAGVPKIMQGMLEGVRPHLKGGAKVQAQSVTIRTPESQMAGGLASIQDANPDVSIGSYPFFKDGYGGSQIVVRSTDEASITKAMADIVAYAKEQGFPYDEVVKNLADALS